MTPGPITTSVTLLSAALFGPPAAYWALHEPVEQGRQDLWLAGFLGAPSWTSLVRCAVAACGIGFIAGYWCRARLGRAVPERAVQLAVANHVNVIRDEFDSALELRDGDGFRRLHTARRRAPIRSSRATETP